MCTKWETAMAIDFALTPTGEADVAGSFSGLLKLRPSTTLLGPTEDARSIRSFLSRIEIESPGETIGNLILTSHATADGALALQLTDGDPPGLNFDILTDALKTNQNVVRASAATVNRADPNAGILVKGCDLGRSPEFMELLQRAIGGSFGLIAALYAFAAGEEFKNTGWIEFLLYELIQDYFLSQNNKFDALDTTKVTALTRTKLLTDMKANPHNRRFDGSSFPDADWEAMIPARTNWAGVDKRDRPRINEVTIRKQFTARYPAAWNLKPFFLTEAEENRLLDIEKLEVVNVQVQTYDVKDQADPPPGNNSPISARRAYWRTKLAAEPTHQATHPYPVYKRYGFATLDDYVDHFDWGNPDPKGNTWAAKTWRFKKTIPITDLATGALICNRYTSTTKQEALLETNNLLFAALPAAL
jgi:hypothetical protein